MDIDYEMLGQDKVVIDLKDFEYMIDLIEYDQSQDRTEEHFPSSFTLELIHGKKSRLYSYRKYRKLSQAELSTRSGVTQALISDIENGKKTGSIATLKALAEALDVYLDDLV